MTRVLLVDDDADQLELRALILRKRGHEVAQAGSAEQALAVAGEFQPDVVVTDYLLPTREAGDRLIRGLRQLCPRARIAVLSGWSGDLAAAADAILRKPVRSEQLLATIARLALGLILLLAGWGSGWAGDFGFRTTEEADVTAEVTARGPAGGLVELRVDELPVFHVNLYAGERDWKYPVFLGRLAAGRHTLRLTAPAGVTARAAGFVTRGPGDALRDVIAHAPVLFAREDTIGKRTDVPLLMYATRQTEDGRPVLEYTVIFSNEDGGTSTRSLMARWGRVTDVEYVYRVWLDADGNAAQALIQGKDHKDVEYSGDWFGRHPLLTPFTDNNMVRAGAGTAVRYQMTPLLADLSEHSREIVMDQNPITYRISVEEIAREGKVRAYGIEDGEKISDPRNYLVVEARLELVDAGLQVLVRVQGETKWRGSAMGVAENFVNRSGWVRVAVEMPPGAEAEALGFQCLAPKKAGRCRVEAIGKVFKLSEDYLPSLTRRVAWTARDVTAGDVLTVELR